MLSYDYSCLKRPFQFLLALLLLHATNAFAQAYYDTGVKNPLVVQNVFLKRPADYTLPPTFDMIKSKLPEPIWPARKDVVACYWKAWQLAFDNVKPATRKNSFIMPYISPAFNNHLFMWDCSFMTMFGGYGHRAFNFQGTLDNFYRAQHKDGFIGREISEENGAEIFAKYDVSSTGPNLMPWAEWEYYNSFNDAKRLAAVFPVLLAYHQWLSQYRAWKDGSYYASGWACGMDNQPRVPAGYDREFSHAFMSWIDTNLQQLFAGKILLKMAAVLNKTNEVKKLAFELDRLTAYLHANMWDKQSAFYYDRFQDGSLSRVKSIAAFWALLAEAVPEGQLKEFVAHLENPKEFARLHRVPTLSADAPEYEPEGMYWRGGVWAPTSYMVLKGLTTYKQDSLAHVIGLNHLDNVVEVFNQTGTLWENYAPDKVMGKYKRDLVGWTGLPPISVLFEYVFGLRPTIAAQELVWDVRLLDEFGVRQYPFGKDGLVDLWCAGRKKSTQKPNIKIKSNVAFKLKLIWEGGIAYIDVKSSS